MLNIRAAVVSCALLVSSQAMGAEMRNARFGAWYAGAYTNDQTGQFSHCAANASYNSGITLFLSVNSNFGWSMGFANRTWSLPVGQNIPITYVVDNYAPRSASARVINKDMVIVLLPDDVGLFQQFRIGNILRVNTGSNTSEFRLTGTANLLNVLLNCARTRGDLSAPAVAARSAPPPPASTPPAPAPSTGGPAADSGRDAAERRLEATQFVANLLAQAEMRGHRLITLTEMRELDLPQAIRASDVAWRGEGTFGTLIVHANRDANSLDAMAADIISGDARACSGEFATARTSDSEMQNVRRLSTFCSDSSSAITLTYLLLPMPGRIIYQMTVVGRAGRSEASAEDRRLRDAVHAIVARHPALGPRQPSVRETGPVGISN